jgi:hypothetical protein
MPWYSASLMQFVVVLSVQLSDGVFRLQRKISQLLEGAEAGGGRGEGGGGRGA